MDKLTKGVFVGMMILAVAMPVASMAALPNPTSPVSGQAVTLSEFQTIIERVAQFLITVGLILAVIFIIWGGIVWMFTADAAKGWARLKGGVIGALIILAVGVILQTLASLINRGIFFN